MVFQSRPGPTAWRLFMSPLLCQSVSLCLATTAALAMHSGTTYSIVPQDSVDDDGLLAVREPAVLAAEPAARLRRSGRHENPREGANDERHDALNQEQPLPSTPAVDAAHPEDSCRE